MKQVCNPYKRAVRQEQVSSEDGHELDSWPPGDCGNCTCRDSANGDEREGLEKGRRNMRQLVVVSRLGIPESLFSPFKDHALIIDQVDRFQGSHASYCDPREGVKGKRRPNTHEG